jgi:hypothetical protein
MEIEDCAQEGLDPGEFRAFPSEAEALGAQNKPGLRSIRHDFDH